MIYYSGVCKSLRFQNTAIREIKSYTTPSPSTHQYLQSKVTLPLLPVHINIYNQKLHYSFSQYTLLYNDFIVNIYIQLDWEQVFTTY